MTVITCNGLEIHTRRYQDPSGLYGNKWRCSIKAPGYNVRLRETQADVLEDAIERAKARCKEMTLKEAISRSEKAKEKDRERRNIAYSRREQRIIETQLTYADMWLQGRI